MIFIPCIGVIASPFCAYNAIQTGKAAQRDPAQYMLGLIGFILGIIAAVFYALIMLLVVLFKASTYH